MMKIPNATYRIQLNDDFGFRETDGIVDYLADLGAFWVYASPIFKARPKSAHGYDTVDFNRLNPELGTEYDFDGLITRIREKNMGWLQDAVPNHMAYTGENPALADLFFLGENSRFFPFFDIRWRKSGENGFQPVDAPFLGEPLEACIENGEISLRMDRGTLGLSYYEHFFPLRLAAYKILDPRTAGSKNALPKTREKDLGRILAALFREAETPPSGERDARIADLRKALQDLVDRHAEIRGFVSRRLSRFDPEKGGKNASSSLKKLLKEQVYALKHWRTATREINYRRFFDINHLICLRQEDDGVFRYTHGLLLRLVREKKIDGLRIDHVDGLRFPEQYLKRLRKTFGNIYVAVEKILGPEETLPASWPVQGTTGYGFADRVTRLFCRPDQKAHLDAFYKEFSGRTETFDRVCVNAKREVLEASFAGDLANLARAFQRAAAAVTTETVPDAETLKKAAVELLVRFPVYRTYGDDSGISKTDAEMIRRVALEAAATRADLHGAFHVMEAVLSAKAAPAGGEGTVIDQPEDKSGDKSGTARTEALARFQQLCAPLAAKGVEDTALYRFNRLISLNEVGGDPDETGISLASFHDFLSRRARFRPHAMNALSTHDSKRSEDVRARIGVLTEIPGEWRKNCLAWQKLNRGLKEIHEGEPVPGGNTEYFLYQTLLGTCPFRPSEREEWKQRITSYMVKAVREAKVHTSWLTPDEGYEDALGRFIHSLLKDDAENPFIKEFMPFARKIAWFGGLNSLSQTLIKITAPGFPDFYQGTELFDFSLVDPDNRRPVDFNRRKELLKAIRRGVFPVFANGMDRNTDPQEQYDRMKLHLVYRALKLRRQKADLFLTGAYAPLKTEGRFARHVIAFARFDRHGVAVVAVPRWLTDVARQGEAPLGAAWKDTRIHLPKTFPKTWLNILAGQTNRAVPTLFCRDLFEGFPAALLIGDKPGG